MRKLTALLPLLLLGAAFAQGDATADLAYAIDTIALLFFAALVAFMQPGFALLEAGLHSAKNTINIFMKNLADLVEHGAETYVGNDPLRDPVVVGAGD